MKIYTDDRNSKPFHDPTNHQLNNRLHVSDLFLYGYFLVVYCVSAFYVVFDYVVVAVAAVDECVVAVGVDVGGDCGGGDDVDDVHLSKHPNRMNHFSNCYRFVVVAAVVVVGNIWDYVYGDQLCYHYVAQCHLQEWRREREKGK